MKIDDRLEDRKNKYETKFEDKARKIEELKEQEKLAMFAIKKKKTETFIQKQRIMQAIIDKKAAASAPIVAPLKQKSIRTF